VAALLLMMDGVIFRAMEGSVGRSGGGWCRRRLEAVLVYRQKMDGIGCNGKAGNRPNGGFTRARSEARRVQSVFGRVTTGP